MSSPQITWGQLSNKHSPDLVEAAKRLFSEGGPFEVSAAEIAAGTSRSEEEAEELLLELSPPLRKVRAYSCQDCHTELTDEERFSERCPSCDKPYSETGEPREFTRFAYDVPRSRDVIWALAVHGMNSRGAWQEEFNWRMSTSYPRSVPVAIYKYGLVRPSAVWRPSLRRLREDVVAKVKGLSGDTEKGGFVGKPDVIAHSLGTWLIGHALQAHPSMKVGRVILTGSILRPDFDWDSLIAKGQVEAVLNHYGAEDFWAGIAHFLIPDSGPSGKRGFNSAINVTQICERDFGHSDFFQPQNLGRMFENVWRPFLSDQLDLELAASVEPADWHPAFWILRATVVPVLLLTLYWIIIVMLAVSCLAGFYGGLSRLL